MDSWSKVVCDWANGLDISTDVKNLMTLTDGKFFAAFIEKYLPWSFHSTTVSETWTKMEECFEKEFPHSLINFPEARSGYEEELTKIVTLLMYLGTVKYPNPKLASTLQDYKQFSKEVQLRIKCILQALMDQHRILTPVVFNEILMSKVSETTGQLVEPVKRNRVAERSSTISRVARPTLGSPVFFFSNGSPLKEFLDSPLTRQTAKHNKQLEEKNGELREIKAELDRERMDNHFLHEENSRLKQALKRLESENCDLKIKVKEVSESRMNESTGTTIDTSDLYHNLRKEYKEQEKYLGSVQNQLHQVEEENSVLKAKLDGLAEKLASATKQKISAELSVDDMKTNLTAAQDENTCLSDNVEELKRQNEDLKWEIQNSIQCGGNNFSTGRKNFARSMPRVLLMADMTGISMDADDSNSALGALGDISENLGDTGLQELETLRDEQEINTSMELEPVPTDDRIIESPEVSNSFMESDSEREGRPRSSPNQISVDNDQSPLSKLKSKSTSDTDSEVDQTPVGYTSSKDGCQTIITDLAKDILNQRDHRLRRRAELTKAGKVRAELMSKQEYLVSQLEQYEQYNNHCLANLNKAGNNKRVHLSTLFWFYLVPPLYSILVLLNVD